MDIASQLQVKEGVAIVERLLHDLVTVLGTMTNKYRDTPMAGRTHLQHALPITFGYKCGVWLFGLRRHAELLEQIKERCLLVQFGGAAGTLASLGPSDSGIRVRKRLGVLLGLKDSRDYMARGERHRGGDYQLPSPHRRIPRKDCVRPHIDVFK